MPMVPSLIDHSTPTMKQQSSDPVEIYVPEQITISKNGHEMITLEGGQFHKVTPFAAEVALTCGLAVTKEQREQELAEHAESDSEPAEESDTSREPKKAGSKAKQKPQSKQVYE